VSDMCEHETTQLEHRGENPIRFISFDEIEVDVQEVCEFCQEIVMRNSFTYKR